MNTDKFINCHWKKIDDMIDDHVCGRNKLTCKQNAKKIILYILIEEKLEDK